MTPAEFKAARASLGLTQAALARVLHCGTPHISHIEMGVSVPSETLCELLRMKVAVASVVLADKDGDTYSLRIVDD